MKPYRIPKLIGIVILSTIFLIAISYIEVFLYSVFVNPGKKMRFMKPMHLYQPLGFLVFWLHFIFLVTRYWGKKGYSDFFQLAWMYPLTYVLWDILILLAIGGVEWDTFWLVFLLANWAKFAGKLTCLLSVYTKRG